MSSVGERYAELRRLLSRARIDEEVATELEHHFDALVERNMGRGMAEAEARREALARFGDLDAILAETRGIDEEIERRRQRREVLGDAWRATGHAVRRLARRPQFTAFAFLTLALALGAFSALYTVLDRVILRPLPYADADRLVWVDSPVEWQGAASNWGVSPAGYFDFYDNAEVFSSLGAFSRSDRNFSSDAGPVRVRAASVTASLMNALAFRPAAGRLFVAEDDVPGAASAVVLGHTFWQNQFGGRRDVIGTSIQLDGADAEVIGVLESGHTLPGRPADVLQTLRLDPLARPVNSHWLSVIGRMRPEANLAGTQASLSRLTAAFPEKFPTAYYPGFMSETGFRTRVIPLKDHVLGEIGRTVWILFAASGLLLLIAVANITNLYLVRTEARRREFAVRLALGASRSHLAWQSLSETLVLALAAGAGAIWVAHLGIRMLLANAPAALPRVAELGVGPVTAIFTLGVTIALGAYLGLVPLAYRGFGHQEGLSREGSARAGPGRSGTRVRRAMLASQVALALVLLTAGGLMLRSLDRLRATEPGFHPDDVLAFDTFASGSQYDSYEDVAAFYRAFLERVEALPGVVGVGATTRLPMGGGGPCALMFIEDRPPETSDQPPCVDYGLVAPGFFEALDIPVRGRAPGWRDVDAATAGVVVTRALAERLWPGEDALGKGIRGNGWERPFFRVEGVADDFRADGLDQPPLEAVFFSMRPIEGAQLWGPPRAMSVTVETTGDPTALVPQIRSALRELDPTIPLANIEGLEATIRSSPSVARVSFTFLLLGIAAGLALLLSTIGMYGVVAQLVIERMKEIAVRMALGARLNQVVRMVLGQSLRVAVIGVVVGLGVALLVSRTLRALLYEIGPGDPVTLLIATSVLLLTVAAAAWLAARQAGRADPVHTLRAE